MGFYTTYKDVFDAVKEAIEKTSSIKSVLLGEQFSYDYLPKAVINALPSDVSQAALGEHWKSKSTLALFWSSTSTSLRTGLPTS